MRRHALLLALLLPALIAGAGALAQVRTPSGQPQAAGMPQIMPLIHTPEAPAIPQAPDINRVRPRLSQAAQVAAGLLVFRNRCAACHYTERGEMSVGPPLRGIVNASAGHVPRYVYTDALRWSGIIWNTTQLDAYLANPKYFVPGTKMDMTGMPDPDERRNVIAYMMTLN